MVKSLPALSRRKLLAHVNLVSQPNGPERMSRTGWYRGMGDPLRSGFLLPFSISVYLPHSFSLTSYTAILGHHVIRETLSESHVSRDNIPLTRKPAALSVKRLKLDFEDRGPMARPSTMSGMLGLRFGPPDENDFVINPFDRS